MSSFFFFNDTATTEIYPLSLHDALPICAMAPLDEEVRFRMPILLAEFTDIVCRYPGISVVRCSSSSSLSIFRRSEEHTSELQSPCNLVCRLLLEKKKHTADLYTRT